MNKLDKTISEDKLQAWGLLNEFRNKLEKELSRKSGGKSEENPNRQLKCLDYFSSVLFIMFNPVVDTMRGMCHASQLEKVQERVCTRKMSLGSFSEAQHVFDPEIMNNVMKELASNSKYTFGDKRIKDAVGDLIAIDGSLLPALPRMYWALWQDDKHRAAKVHLKFSVLRQIPVEAPVTSGKKCERKVLRTMIRPGEFYVGDRYYGLEYGFFKEITDNGASYAIRIRNNPRKKILKTYDLTQADKDAGVVSDQLVKLGGKDSEHEAIRLVTINAFDGKKILVVTSEPQEKLAAELVSIIYSYRWQIETFFKWIKCILGCRHLLAESQDGVAIQIYATLIAAILLFRLTEKRPTKRDMETIRWYFSGLASIDELETILKIKK
jgi:hypothetical protein